MSLQDAIISQLSPSRMVFRILLLVWCVLISTVLVVVFHIPASHRLMLAAFALLPATVTMGAETIVELREKRRTRVAVLEPVQVVAQSTISEAMSNAAEALKSQAENIQRLQTQVAALAEQSLATQNKQAEVLLIVKNLDEQISEVNQTFQALPTVAEKGLRVTVGTPEEMIERHVEEVAQPTFFAGPRVTSLQILGVTFSFEELQMLVRLGKQESIEQVAKDSHKPLEEVRVLEEKWTMVKQVLEAKNRRLFLSRAGEVKYTPVQSYTPLKEEEK